MSVKSKKAKSKLEKVEIEVVGLRYRLTQAHMDEISDTLERHYTLPCRLEREPDNKADSNAVKVLCNYSGKGEFVHIGYVPRGVAKPLSKLLAGSDSVKSCSLVFLDPKLAEGTIEVRFLRP